MVRALAAALVVVCVGTADAAPKRKVKVTTDPPGATVYLETVEDNPVCEATPCTIELPPGEHNLVIDLKDHQRQYQGVVVPRRGKISDVKVKMEAALGTIVVDGPAGASVVVDDVDQGKAPTKVEVSAESHHVVVTLKGKSVFDDYIDVAAGAEVPIEAGKRPPEVGGGGGGDGDGDGDGGDGDGDGDGDGGDGGGGDGDGGGGSIGKTTTPKPARGPFVTISAAVDIGFRNFSYQNVETPTTLRDESEGGQVLAGPLVEVWIGELARIRLLRGLSLLARYQYGLNKQEVVANGLSMPMNTFWQSLEVSLRHRWTFAQKVTAEVGGGYVRDQFQFEGAAVDIAKVPDVDYQCFRLGGRGSLLLGNVEPYLAIENRIVTSGGKLSSRFAASDTSGLRGALGVGITSGKLHGRVEGSLTRYSWDFSYEASAAMRAESASDTIKQVQFSFGYAY